MGAFRDIKAALVDVGAALALAGGSRYPSLLSSLFGLTRLLT